MYWLGQKGGKNRKVLVESVSDDLKMFFYFGLKLGQEPMEKYDPYNRA